MSCWVLGCGPSEDDGISPSSPALPGAGEPFAPIVTAVATERPSAPLGVRDIGGRAVSAARFTEVIPGGPAEFLITMPPDPNHPAVRFWIGSLDATSPDIQPAAGDATLGRYEARAFYPDTLPENAALWVEIEDFNGDIKRGAFPLK